MDSSNHDQSVDIQELSFSDSMTPHSTNLSDKIITQEKMISKVITMHFCLMMTLTTIHLLISLTVAVSLFGAFSIKNETKACSTMHLFNHGLYLLFNILVLLFFFDCARNSRIHSTDVLIFTTKKKVAKYGIPIPFILFAGHFMANYTCKSIKFPRFHTVVYCCHLLVELGMMYAYFGWYQKQLVNLTDATELDEIGGEGDGQNERTFNF